MSNDDYPSWFRRWFRQRRRPLFSPFFRGGLFDDFDETMREMDVLMEDLMKDFETKVPKNLIRERELPDGGVVKEMGPFVYGYSFSVGPDGKPQFREFGNIKPVRGLGTAKPTLDVQGEREPLVDVIPSDGEVKVIAELPGVEKTDIKLNVDEDGLSISVDTESRKFRKHLDLPAKVDPDSAKASYKNGVLEVVLKTQKERPKGKSVGVE